jgi:hypothetical protein
MSHESDSHHNSEGDRFASHEEASLQMAAQDHEVKDLIVDMYVQDSITLGQAAECSDLLKAKAETPIDVMGRLLTYSESR